MTTTPTVTVPGPPHLRRAQNRNGPNIWCWCCERLIPRTEPVYRCRTCTRGGGAHHHGAQLCADCWAKPAEERRSTQLDFFGGLHTYICTQLLSPWSDETRAHPQPCDGCGRPVVTGYNDYRRWTVCSEPCRVAARREHQRAERVDAPDRCVGCGAPMPGGRRGRRWCSPACKQRAYRERMAERRRAIVMPRPDGVRWQRQSVGTVSIDPRSQSSLP